MCFFTYFGFGDRVMLTTLICNTQEELKTVTDMCNIFTLPHL